MFPLAIFVCLKVRSYPCRWATADVGRQKLTLYQLAQRRHVTPANASMNATKTCALTHSTVISEICCNNNSSHLCNRFHFPFYLS